MLLSRSELVNEQEAGRNKEEEKEEPVEQNMEKRKTLEWSEIRKPANIGAGQ